MTIPHIHMNFFTSTIFPLSTPLRSLPSSSLLLSLPNHHRFSVLRPACPASFISPCRRSACCPTACLVSVLRLLCGIVLGRCSPNADARWSNRHLLLLTWQHLSQILLFGIVAKSARRDLVSCFSSNNRFLLSLPISLGIAVPQTARTYLHIHTHAQPQPLQLNLISS